MMDARLDLMGIDGQDIALPSSLSMFAFTVIECGGDKIWIRSNEHLYCIFRSTSTRNYRFHSTTRTYGLAIKHL